MNIKYQAIAQNLRQKLYSVYILTGQDHYLLNDAALAIKKAWRQRGECDEQTIQLNVPADWTLLREEANSYSLFSEYVLLDARCDKKTIDAAGKKMLQHYILNINSRCLIILRAPNVPSKQLQLLANNEHTVLVQAYPFAPAELQRWITTQLQHHAIRHEPQIPALIHQYTQGNMLACAQVIEKLVLINNEGELLTTPVVLEQLSDQCDYQLYELADACLSARADKAIHLLRQACQNKTEPTLILWLLSQEIRLLIQLDHLLKQSMPISTACSQLKIWPQRSGSYEKILARLPLVKLQQLLQTCQQLDEQIKSNQSVTIWHGLESVALALCCWTYDKTACKKPHAIPLK